MLYRNNNTQNTGLEVTFTFLVLLTAVVLAFFSNYFPAITPWILLIVILIMLVLYFNYQESIRRWVEDTFILQMPCDANSLPSRYEHDRRRNMPVERVKSSYPTIRFNVPISECASIIIGDRSCSHPVGLDESVGMAVKLIMDAIDAETTAAYRKAPLVLSRCPRGGKSTILSAIHKRLQHEHLNCLSVSFNGVSPGFQRNLHESDVESLFRMVSNELNDTVNRQESRTVDWDSVDKYIGEMPFVLIIDEINLLSQQIGSELANILKKNFLDKRNRFLVMSTHQPFMASVDKANSKDLLVDANSHVIGIWSDSVTPSSSRSIELLPMPESYDLAQLLEMDQKYCRGLTRSQASFYGGIPSLMYIVSIQTAELPATKFSLVHRTICKDKSLFADFAEALITGIAKESLHKFMYYNSQVLPQGNLGIKVKWPLCYVQCIINLFSCFEEARAIVDCINTLANDSKTTGYGMVWEQSVRIAILLRFVISSNRGWGIPFKLCLDVEAQDAMIELQALPVGNKSVEGAKIYIENFASCCDKNTLVLFYPVEAAFVQFDGFCARFEQRRLRSVCGYQCKDNDKGAEGVVPSWITAHGHLLRSDAPMKCRKCAANSNGWKYYNSKATDVFMGWTLQIMRDK